MPRPPRPRGSLIYDKQALSLDDLVLRMAERGLEIPDRERAARYLRHIGYFRLSPYTIPFQQGQPDHAFRIGAAFDDVLDLYVFDRALRLLVMDALERVEVAVRAALTDHMSTAYEEPHWYVEAAHFQNHGKHTGLLRIVRDTSATRLTGAPEPVSHPSSVVYRSALEHYLLTYGEPELPPSWLMVETLTLGQLNNVIDNLRLRADRTAIARRLGLTDPVLTSWLRTFVRIRNICAHHGRLWNVGIGVYPAIPASPAISWLKGDAALPARSEKRLYPVLVSLQSVLDVVSPRSTWARRLHRLLSTRPPMNLAGMGVPAGWAEDEFWARHLD
ncbi:Abi family protein [Microbacterium sp. WCS2018Hpa-23]|uniref:Abi family protein n=1 Tax=Microbacterium sp. WCS2018Hpa-23 TaxID=3073634 RepID=UPI00288355E6|nr:Abi family protein [Microbacterium sp. WCS2018Hpa-23]